MEQIVLKVGHVFGADHPWNVSLEGLSEDVAEATDGNVEIEVYPSSQLGGDRDMAEGIQMGTIEMGLFGTGALQSLDERLIVEELPYAWPTREHAYNAIDGELGEALAEILKEQGMHTISWWESGYRHITNSVKPINSPSDLEGIKLRVPEAQLRIDTFDELGAMPTPMAFSEVFYGLQQNVIDGQENPLATIYDSKFYEVQEHLALTGHIWGSAVLTISESAWNDIPDEYKDIIAEKAEEWKEKEREMIREQDDELVKKLEEAGMKVTQPDVKPFQEIVQSMWSEYEDEFGKELIEIVKQYSSE
ncbi:C4-dicarboxylate ABC transporter substrate-binding protein [Virgibacillus profundi]|uniref:C4-dicarboxylate ABC transporter substrate-binding protein n=2 Tax=Virgibacillus profundi TaxID=2024555 RepID=A0A2A2IAV9_9BACI|nr:C4-dicarboxylate ABC transporter substrate-binding protein [Virgibacillus profundi]PXY52339.1 C4-dicarboxylate ABC transporter substrate-binding protein [Virgibacillus profundi]